MHRYQPSLPATHSFEDEYDLFDAQITARSSGEID